MSVGWGRLSWGQASWNEATTIKEGWGRLGWGSQSYGDAPTVTLSGQQATTSVGSITVELRPGWGTLDWGENGWGTVESAVVNLTAPSAMTSNVGAITPADVVGLTGQAATTSTGEFTFVLSPTITPTGQVATVSEGQLSLNSGADHVQGLATLVSTTAVGSMTVGIGVPLTGVSATASVGTITPADIMGLTGQEAVSSVGDIIVLGFEDVNIVGNTNYSDVDVVGETSYTDVTHVA
jgi:hypothetical protein